MEITNRFSLEDFLAYFFPGVLVAFALYLFLLMTPLGKSVSQVSGDHAAAVLVLALALSYVLGNLLSAFAERVFRRATRSHSTRLKARIPLSELEPEVFKIYKEHFKHSGDKFSWSETCYYICRSLVIAFMPGIVPLIQRQSSLRQLRMNLIGVVVVWSLLGVAWGIRFAVVGSGSTVIWGLGLSLASLFLWYPVTKLLFVGMERHEEREIREVLTAFVAGYHSGAFRREKTG